MTADADFAAYCRGQDLRALGRVFDATAPELAHVARHLCRNAADADDALQQTFLTAIETRARFRPGERVLPWLLGILANHVRESSKKHARPLARVLREERLAPDPLASAELEELTRRVDRVLAELAEPYGPVLTLYLRHGLTAEEIATSLRRPAGTVRSQVTRGLELLRTALPAGFALGATALVLPAQAHAQIRHAVLAHAGATASQGALGLVTGAIVMKKVLAASLLLLSLGLGLWAWPAPAGKTRTAERVGARPDSRPAEASQPGAGAAADRTPVEASRPQASTGEVLVRVRFAADRSPAEGVTLEARQEGDDPFQRPPERTDARGEIPIGGLVPGPLFVTVDRGGTGRIEVRAGVRQTLELEVPIGIDVRGLVVDAEDRPIPGARIMLQRSKVYLDDALEVARSDASGRFCLRSVRTQMCVAAFAAGHAPSELVEVTPTNASCKLVAERRESVLSGIVFDSAGRPVANARVLAGAARRMTELPGLVPRAPSWNLRTDATGRFQADGVPNGATLLPLWVGASGMAAWHRDLTLDADGSTFVEVRLQGGASLAGSVRDDTGQPLAKAQVSVRSPGIWPQPGMAPAMPGWVRTTCWSRADGGYALCGLPAGETRAFATLEGRNGAEHAFVAVAGREERWDAVLASGRVLRGSVVDEQGAPLASLGVSLAGQHGGVPATPREAVTDAAGQFAIAGCADVAYCLTVWPDAKRRNVPLLQQDGVRTEQSPLSLRVPNASLGRCAIHALVLDDTGAPVADAKAIVMRAGSFDPRPFEVDPSTGRIRIGQLAPGSYEVRVSSATRGSAAPIRVDLLADADLDAGVVRLARPGTFTLVVRDADGKPHDVALSASLARGDDRGRHMLVGKKDTLRSPPLQPGEYWVWFRTPLHRERVVVVAGEDTKATVTLPRGHARSFRLVGGAQLPERVEFVWRTAAGVELSRYTDDFRSGSSFAFERVLVAGAYVVEASDARGGRTETEFTVEAKTPAPAAVEIRLP